MPKHCAYLSVRLLIETEDNLSTEEVDELISSLDYSFESEYGTVSTQISEQEIMWINKNV